MDLTVLLARQGVAPVAVEPPFKMLSVVFPDDYQSHLDGLKNLSQVELICISKSEARTRAGRLNLGITKAQGEMILLYHPRSRLDEEGVKYLLKRNSEKIWGGFTHQFDQSHLLLRYTSWYSNRVRPKYARILYLDHCIFFHRSFLDKPIPEVPIFEDTLLSRQLRKHQKPQVLPFFSVTSSVRYQKNGVIRQASLNQLMKLGFLIGISPETLNCVYERGLGLN